MNVMVKRRSFVRLCFCVLKWPLSFGLTLTDFFSYNIKLWNLQNDTTSIFKHPYTFLHCDQLVFNERHGEMLFVRTTFLFRFLCTFILTLFFWSNTNWFIIFKYLNKDIRYDISTSIKQKHSIRFTRQTYCFSPLWPRQ